MATITNKPGRLVYRARERQRQIDEAFRLHEGPLPECAPPPREVTNRLLKATSPMFYAALGALAICLLIVLVTR